MSKNKNSVIVQNQVQATVVFQRILAQSLRLRRWCWCPHISLLDFYHGVNNWARRHRRRCRGLQEKKIIRQMYRQAGGVGLISLTSSRNGMNLGVSTANWSGVSTNGAKPRVGGAFLIVVAGREEAAGPSSTSSTNGTKPFTGALKLVSILAILVGAGLGSSSAPSANGMKPLAGALTLDSFLVARGGGDGSSSPGAGSRKGTIFDEPEAEPEELDAIRFERPACLIVVPTIFLTSGTFSLILVLRVPKSFHSFPLSSAAWASAPVGSTNI